MNDDATSCIGGGAHKYVPLAEKRDERTTRDHDRTFSASTITALYCERCGDTRKVEVDA